MTQHPFDREFSEEEAAKLNAEQKQTDSGDELNEDELEGIAGGIWPGLTDGINEGGATKGIFEGGITAGIMEGGGPWKDGNDLPTK
jgi:hypothetical protein